MPYFVYKVFADRRVEPLEDFESYRDAKDRARQLRAALPDEADHTVRLIFARNPDEAERLLTEVREPRPLGEE